MHLIPGKARERILDWAATQLEDGGAYHQYQPLTKKGNSDIGGNFNDNPLWLILSTTLYIKETGDFSILDEMVPYNNDESKARPLLDHLKRSFLHVVNNLGPHGLPLIGRADWNDCLNLNCFSTNTDESFQTTENKSGRVAEPVLIAGKDAWKPGEAKNSWLTGAAAWNFFAISQHILGIQPGYDGLVINPCIPKEWDGFSIQRKFRGIVYKIKF